MASSFTSLTEQCLNYLIGHIDYIYDRLYSTIYQCVFLCKILKDIFTYYRSILSTNIDADLWDVVLVLKLCTHDYKEFKVAISLPFYLFLSF